MTGFGAASGHVGTRRVVVEVRSVNHRFFNPTIRLSGELARFEWEVREAMRRRVSRGHVTLTTRVEATDEAPIAIDEGRLASYVRLLRGLQARHGLSGDVDLATVLRLPDVLGASPGSEAGEGVQLVELADVALAALGASREAEGQRLRGYLTERLGHIDSALERIAARAPARVVAHRDRLQAAVAELAAGVQVDPQRLAAEVALLAERLDIGEELARFRSHLAAFRAALDSEGKEPVGKRLGFLLQELLREANTTGSKSNDAALTDDVLVIKEELERLREQVENLE